MKTITSLNEPVAVILHCELRLELQAAAERLAESRATKRKIKETPVTDQDTVSPSFTSFAETWFDDNVARWKHSYKLTLRTSLDKHILPAFGKQAVNQISRSDILSFRAGLSRRPGRGDVTTLSPARVNTVMVPLRLILNEAADRFDFESPYVRIKALKVPRSCITPFTLDEVNSIISKAREDYQPYLKIRFFTVSALSAR